MRGILRYSILIDTFSVFSKERKIPIKKTCGGQIEIDVFTILVTQLAVVLELIKLLLITANNKHQVK